MDYINDRNTDDHEYFSHEFDTVTKQSDFPYGECYEYTINTITANMNLTTIYFCRHEN